MSYNFHTRVHAPLFSFNRASAQPGDTETFNVRGLETSDPGVVFSPGMSLQVSGRTLVDYGAAGSYVADGLQHVNPLTGSAHLSPVGKATSTCEGALDYVCVLPARAEHFIEYQVFQEAATVRPSRRQFILRLLGKGPLNEPSDFSAGGDIGWETGDLIVVFQVVPVPAGVLAYGTREAIAASDARRKERTELAPPKTPEDLRQTLGAAVSSNRTR